MSIKGVTYSNQSVSAADHAGLFEMLISDGILYGCGCSSSLNVFTISSGAFITAGRIAKIIGSETITMEAPNNEQYARIILLNDMNETATTTEFRQVKFVTEYSATQDGFRDLVKENINVDGEVYEVVWATLTLGNNSVIQSFNRVIPTAGGGGGGTGAPVFTYTGTYELDDSDIANNNWRLLLKTSGDLSFSDLGSGGNGVDIFFVGGGGMGSSLAGGGGGYVKTINGYTLSRGNIYPLTIGAGGISGVNNGDGESTIGFGETVSGGSAGSNSNGGSGGSGGGSRSSSVRGPSVTVTTDEASIGGANGANGGSFASTWTGGSATYNGGSGSGATTREFKETDNSWALYAGGGAGSRITNNEGTAWAAVAGADGGGGAFNSNGTGESGTANTGGGGAANGGNGGSGIIIIRNHRTTPAA